MSDDPEQRALRRFSTEALVEELAQKLRQEHLLVKEQAGADVQRAEAAEKTYVAKEEGTFAEAARLAVQAELANRHALRLARELSRLRSWYSQVLGELAHRGRSSEELLSELEERVEAHE